ncbi:MAG: hypothetical protein GX672_08655 [Synergistaceae bacterium]|nr:hypothetical protein [Synergistaceae bacterium]
MSRGKSIVYDEFYKSLNKVMRNKSSLQIVDIYSAFPEMKEKTVSWYMHKLVHDGKVNRVKHGVYSLKTAGEIVVPYDRIQMASRKLYDEMQEYGYPFYISGIDALIGKMQHIPEQYPVVMVVEQKSSSVIREGLITKSKVVISKEDVKNINRNLSMVNVDVILLSGKNFSVLSSEGMAFPEKGFVDLYYVVTRIKYPMSMQELSRTYESLTRHKSFSQIRILDAAKDTGISDEITWLLKIAKMTKEAQEFAFMQLREVLSK